MLQCLETEHTRTVLYVDSPPPPQTHPSLLRDLRDWQDDSLNSND